MSLAKNIYEYGDMIKLGHTLFAMPFALSGVCIARIAGHPVSWQLIAWILLAFTGARSAAMGFNRIADAAIDAQNPRTKDRAVAAGRISKNAAWIFVLLSCAIFLFSAWMINTLCFVLAFPALALLFGYSYSKRFTYASHFILGFALALAPIGAWIAVSGNFDFRILALAAALVFQIAAFDILYANQDRDFDGKNSLFSIPAVFGEARSLQICFALFALAGAMLFLNGFLFNLGVFYFACAALIAAVYFTGFRIFKKSGLAEIGLVFFYMNAAASILMLVSVLPQAIL